MKSILQALSIAGFASLAVLAGSCAPAQRPTAPTVIPELAGRTAGAPQRCVPTRPSDSLRIVDAQTVIYGSGQTVWVNRPASTCPGMDQMDVLVVDLIGSQYCRGDRVRTIDPVTKIPGPSCILGDFVPYRR
jgi:hypothetical protein